MSPSASPSIIRAFCERVGIPFIAEALQWDNIPRSEKITWWIGGDEHHDNLKASTGFRTNRFKDYVNVADVPKLARTYDECLPFYQKLHAERLQVAS